MIINHDVVMKCSIDLLRALAMAVGVADSQLTIKASKLRAIVGTKLANSATLSTQYADSTLDHAVLVNDALNAFIDSAESMYAEAEAEAMNAAFDAERKAHADSAGKCAGTISAKAWLIMLFNKCNDDGTPVRYTLAELIALTGKTEVNIRTMLSDLRSARYAGKYGVYVTHSVRIANVTYYHKAQ